MREPYPQVPSARTGTHSYFGQQVAGSVATTFAPHLQSRGAGQALVAPVDVVLVGRHGGQWYVGQQVVGSTTSSLTGACPSGQASAIAGQMARAGSQVGGFGAHLPSQSSVLQLPAASQTQLRSMVASQPQTLSAGGTGAVGSFVTGVPPALQPQPVQVISQ
jgi:hypothetical protein